MHTPEPRLCIICPACQGKYEQNDDFLCPFCGYELISVPYPGALAEGLERRPELYLQGMLNLISFLPYFRSTPHIETDPRIRPIRALPAEIKQLRRVFYDMGLNVHAFPEVIGAAARKHPKGKLDPYQLDIRCLRAVLTLIFQREKDLGLNSIADAVNNGLFQVILLRIQHLLEESGVLEGRQITPCA